MNRPFTALLAFLDALLVAAFGLGILLVPLTLLWLTQFELAVDYGALWRVAANFWLLGNGVDLVVTIDPALVVQLGLDGAASPFQLGFAPLGIAALTIFLGHRSGARLAGTPHRMLGTFVGIITVAALGGLVAQSARVAQAEPMVGHAFVFPALLYAVGLATSLYDLRASHRGLDGRGTQENFVERAVRLLVLRLPEEVRAVLALALRGGALAAAAIMAVAGAVVFLLMLGNYGQIISLYESLQSGLVGGIALTVGQLPVVPNLVVWAASWLIGPGFAVGAGSAVSPIGTQLGLVPSIPVLGALPQHAPAVGYAVILVPVIIGFAVGVALKQRPLSSGKPIGAVGLVLAGLGTGIVGASILAVLAIWSGGAAGPGRLAEIGPDPGAVWIWAALELSISSALGLGILVLRRFFGERVPSKAPPERGDGDGRSPDECPAASAEPESDPDEAATAEIDRGILRPPDAHKL